MVLGMESRDKQSVLTIWEGEFNFLSYKKIFNLLLDANEQITSFLIEKVSQAL